MSEVRAAYILAGGKSERMGQPKALLPVGPQSVIERSVQLLQGLFPVVRVVTNQPQLYASLGVPMLSDRYVGQGPLAGLQAALANAAETSASSRVFILSCDMPMITADLVTFLTNRSFHHPIVVPLASDFVHHLCGVYHTDCLPALERMLNQSGNQSALPTETRDPAQHKRGCPFKQLMRTLSAEVIDVANLYPDYREELFLNMNTPQDYQRVLKIIG